MELEFKGKIAFSLRILPRGQDSGHEGDMFGKFISGLPVVLLNVLVFRVVNALLNALQIYPEVWIVERIMTAPTEAWVEVARWALILIISIMAWALFRGYKHLAKKKISVFKKISDWTRRDLATFLMITGASLFLVGLVLRLIPAPANDAEAGSTEVPPTAAG